MSENRKTHRMTGGQAVVEALRAQGVDTVFGLIGSAAMEIFDALYDASDIRYIGVHDERTGVHMADGYARASGRCGIFIAGQNGPGATNLVTGLAQAKAAFSPVISIAGALSTQHVDRDAFQEVDQQALFVPITKRTWTVTQTSRIAEIMREAFRYAMAPRRGPVHVNLPRDLLAGSCEYSPLRTTHNYDCERGQATHQQIAQAADLMCDASQPVIIAGGGIKNCDGHQQAIELAEAFNCPIATSPGHGDAVVSGHPLNAGQMGPRGNPVASYLVKNADVILALGTRLGFNSTFYSYENINEHAKIIHVEQEPTAIARYFPVALGVCADAVTVAVQLKNEVEKRGAATRATKWINACLRRRQDYLRQRDESAPMEKCPIQPAALFKIMRDVLPKDTAFTLDAGTTCLQATDELNYAMPPCQFTPLDFGLVGFSFACGLGVKAAVPHRTVVSLMGDGGFGMTLSELSTAVDSSLHTITIVMNNRCWGAEKAYQRDFFDARYIGADVSSPPFDKIAQFYGASGYAVETTAQFADALQAALTEEKPVVIDVQVDPSALYSFRRDSFQHRT